MLNYRHGVNYVSGGGVSHNNLNRVTGGRALGSSADTANRNVVEIHLHTPGVAGTGRYHPETGDSVSVDIENNAGGSSLGPNVRSGVAEHPGFSDLGGHRRNEGHYDYPNDGIGSAGVPGNIPGSTDISVTTASGSAGAIGGGPVASRTGIVTNVGVGHHGAGGALGGNVMSTVVATRADRIGGRIDGHIGRDLEISRILGSASGTGGGSSATAVVGIGGLGMRNGISGRISPDIVRHRARGAEAGSLVGTGGAVATAATGGSNNVGFGVGTGGASYVSTRTSGGPGIAGAGGSFLSSDRSVSAGITGSRIGTELESSSSRGNRFLGHTGGTGERFDPAGAWDEGFGSGDDFGGEDRF